ncbi:MAG: DNA-processing protein DprA [Syntrophomonadaceae bacterium]|jgi:DNA processing protein
MERIELAVLCTLHSIKGIGNRTLFKIKEAFGSFAGCFYADAGKLYSSFLTPAVVEEVIKARKNVNPEDFLEDIRQQNYNITWIEQKDYPQTLRTIADPPYILYYRGDIRVTANVCIALVGSRNATPYGKKVARNFGQELANQNIVVVSGMARGIDTEAHWGALAAGGQTVAVLGSGLNVIYPRENEKLFYEISNNGCVISEFPPAAYPEPGNFPRRNRIIAGLARGVLIVEAKKKSGALITADFALEQGRDVFAIPGHITSPSSEGTNDLIKQGAKMVTCLQDILEEYYDLQAGNNIASWQEIGLQLDNNEKIIIQCMGYEPLHFDDLLSITKFDIGLLSTMVLNLEFKGVIKGLPGNYYVRI